MRSGASAKIQIAEPTPRGSDSVRLGWGQNYISYIQIFQVIHMLLTQQSSEDLCATEYKKMLFTNNVLLAYILYSLFQWQWH